MLDGALLRVHIARVQRNFVLGMLLSAAVSGLFGCGAGCGGAQSGSRGTASVEVGDRAPEFMLQDQSGRVRQLAEYRGHAVVLYFYPRDATPGCTREACAFRDAWERLSATGAVVLGVSTDDVASHRRFQEEHQLPFDLLSDAGGQVAQQYGAPLTSGLSARIRCLTDGDGTVRRVFRDVDPAVHADEVIAAIQALPESEGGDTGAVP